MTMLPRSEIVGMRATAEQTMDGTAIILTKTKTSDGAGDGTIAWNPSGTVACHLSPVTGLEREVGSKITTDADWVATLPAETAVTTLNQVRIAGKDYAIEAARAPRTWELTRRLELNELS